ncbi:hypothetical protein ACE6H2_000748 [Prunus campanulata]
MEKLFSKCPVPEDLTILENFRVDFKIPAPELKTSITNTRNNLQITNANADFHNRVVESVGDGVKNLKPGDHVLSVFTGECGDCVHCKSEESNMCDLLRINTDRGVMIGDGKQRFSKNGTPINQFLGTSTFSEYTVIHEGRLAKIDPSAPLDKVCILSCGVSTGLGATLNVAKPKKGSSVAVLGLGAVGLAVFMSSVGDFNECLLITFRQKLEVEKFITRLTHRVPFSEINNAFDYMLNIFLC